MARRSNGDAGKPTVPKRANGEGNYMTLPSGKTRLRVVVEVDGIEQRKSFTGKSPTDCRNQYKAWLASDSKVSIERVQTLRQWAGHWLEVYKEPFVSWKVGRDYRMYVERHIVDAVIDKKVLGDLKLADIRPAHIAKLYAQKSGMSHSALNYMRISLNGIFATAIDNGLCVKNPAANVPLPETKAADIHAFTKSQVAQIIAHLDKHANGPYVALLLYTGLRIGELLALTWADIDTDSQVIHVRRSLTRDERGEVIGDTTKTKKERIIPYDDTLKKYLDLLPRHGLYVICRPDGSYYKHRGFDGLYYQFFDDLNAALPDDAEPIPRMSPHKCRHTFATYMLRSGTDIRYVQALLGHSTIKTTEIYTDVSVDDLRDNIKKLQF